LAGLSKKAPSKRRGFVYVAVNLISQKNYFCRNWHRKLADLDCQQIRLPGFHRAGPSTPLDENRVNFSVIKQLELMNWIITHLGGVVKSFRQFL